MKQDQPLRVPAFCPICDGLMMGRSTFTYYDYGACVDCYIYFIEGRPQRWLDGWRPDKAEIEALRTWAGK
jgi:hypothetical protein